MRMARRDDGQEFRIAPGEARDGSPTTIYSFARMRARRHPDGPPPRSSPCRAETVRGSACLRGRRRNRISDCRATTTCGGTEPLAAARHRPYVCARQRDNRASSALKPVSAVVTSAGTSVRKRRPFDQNERNRTIFERENGIGPDLGFSEERDIRLPVIEETALCSAGTSMGTKLVDGAGRQPLGDDSRRRCVCRRSPAP